MSGNVAPDTAALFAIAFEWGLYGISVWMFVRTMKELLFGISQNWKMALAACLFFSFSTCHAIVDLVRMKIGFIDKRESPGGPVLYFADVTEVLFLVRSSFYLAQTLLADAVVVYRCNTVWRPKSRWIVYIPLTLWTSLVATSIGALYNLGVAARHSGTRPGVEIFAFAKWVNAFFALSLATNLVGTGLLAFRIWTVNQTTTEFRETGFMMPVFRVVIDAGLLYTITLTATLVVFEAKSNAQTITLDILMPIISISFYMLILRVATLAKRGPPRSTDISLEPTSISSRSVNWSAPTPLSRPREEEDWASVHSMQKASTSVV
ncbi:hypothetical protein K435DRAFT_856127 [Dendrothele bispora CBS 962.96]|uniref:Uncharacterized protein n=1 Tax=Dendrothele bispora (strain CBS 962.96) TaxID=1314807 RepID=A0A4S8M9Q7_DENBC|nr:hypothetical protein K435DRAFT_856127 [Dendrothele bispora CBS 962.96]